eukprot:GHRR01008317.1.p1 GENE.GHRR01008317.1~~GHRR01008317.1.p1  ORF type:complete len:595 (+),score=186.44 GHRR01008317.1:2246-4030(+)
MWRCLVAWVCLCTLRARWPFSAEGASCGHNAVRHLQERQLRSALGDDYNRHHGARRLQLRNATASALPPTRLQKLLASSQAGDMRIMPAYQLEAGYLTAQQSQQLQQVLVPGAINVLQQYVKVRIPSTQPIKAVRESIEQYCGEADASVVFEGPGYSDTDYVFYITALDSGACSDNVIAYTIICHLEPYTYRPNVAAINLCPKFWALSGPAVDKQVSALVHEMIHGLGFSDRMYPFLYDSSSGVQYNQVVQEYQIPGTPGLGLPRLPLPVPSLSSAKPRLPGPTSQAAYQRDNSVASSTISSSSGTPGPVGIATNAAAQAAGLSTAAQSQRRVLFVVTPKLAAFARQYYNCSALPGAPADALSEGSHWRQANINHELMQPASAEDSQRKRISQFTLNFLEDTGWYVTDKSSAQELEWGRGAGCSFVLDGCSSYATSHPAQGYYCAQQQADKDVCTYDSRGIGVCSAMPNAGCYTARADADNPLLYCQDSSSFRRVGRDALAHSMQIVGGIIGSHSSRCFHTPQQICTGNSRQTSSSGNNSKVPEACSEEGGSAVCMEAACDGAGRLFVLLRVPGSNGDVARLACTDGELPTLPM